MKSFFINFFCFFLSKKSVIFFAISIFLSFASQEAKAIEKVAFGVFNNAIAMQVAYNANACFWPDGPTHMDITITASGGQTLTHRLTVYNRAGGTEFYLTDPQTWFIPGETFSFRVLYTYADPFGWSYTSLGQLYNGTFQPIVKPNIISRSVDNFATKIDLQYEYLNDISAEALLEIYDGNTKISSRAGSSEKNYVYTFSHTGLVPGTDHDYKIKAIYTPGNYPDSPVQTHYSNVSTGSAFDINFVASTDVANKVKLSWNKASNTGATGYVVSRKDADNNSLTVYDTDDINNVYYEDGDNLIPGYYYNYTINPKGGSTDVYGSFNGRSLPDGQINGAVSTLMGGAVANVEIQAKRQDIVPTDTTSVYYAYTDNNGSYSISEIFYNEESSFLVTPVLAEHEFDPVDRNVTLLSTSHVIAGTNFTDISSFTVSGNISQQTPMGLCPMGGVEILLDNLSQGMGIFTDADGNYSLAIPQAADYIITPKLQNHHFSPEKIDVLINDNMLGQDFVDTTTFVLDGYVNASCDIYIGQAELSISDLDNCFETTIVTDIDSGYYSVELPARMYTIEMTSFTSVDEGQIKAADVMDYFIKDTVSMLLGDTLVNLKYRLAPTLTISGLGELNTCDNQPKPIMEQGKPYEVIFTVTEDFYGSGCNTDIGYIIVQQDINNEDIQIDTLHLVDGVDTMMIVPGGPNIIEPYLKFFTATAHIGYQTAEVQYDVLVTGNRPRGETFTTVSPSLPFLILHDPPGDGSYSYMEENTTVESTMSFSVGASGSVNAWAEVKLGTKFEAGQFLFVETKIWGTVKGSIEIGASFNANEDIVLSMTNTESYSTSGNDNIIGDDGDVYAGGAMNLIYALTDIISYNHETCEVEKTQNMIVAPDGFKTTFMYTEGHIEDVLIPQLNEMRMLSLAQDEEIKADDYANQMSVWQQMIDFNKGNIEKAKFVENVSFSPGVGYESSMETSSSESMTFEFGLYVDQNLAIEAGMEAGGSGISGGVKVNYRTEFGYTTGSTVSESHRTGFVLEDDDPGDFFSVDILEDGVYGVPAFSIKAGRSSCPWEKGTQKREGVQLISNVYSQDLASETDAAVFQLQLGNTSESNEDQTYNLVFDPTSNPDGAIVTIGGSPVIGNVPTPYTITAGESATATVTVKKGPLVSSYSDLTFILESDCDGSISDEVLLTVNFPTECSPMRIDPLSENNLIVNQAYGNVFKLEVSEYDRTHIELLEIQYSHKGSGAWSNVYITDADGLSSSAVDVLDIPLENLDDDTYLIKAKVSYEDDVTYSNSLELIVDRTAPTMLGTPRPLQGLLGPGDNISIDFDEPIDCGLLTDLSISFVNLTQDTSDVDMMFGCYENGLFILSDFTGVVDEDYIQVAISGLTDYYGNVSHETFIWGFEVMDVDTVLTDPLLDTDRDGVVNLEDNCILNFNPEQDDLDDDGMGDFCDGDMDGDSYDNDEDNCPGTANSDQADSDGDGIGDVCDEMAISPNPFDMADILVYPNPFSTELKYNLKLNEATKVTLELCNGMGQSIQVIMDNAFVSGYFSGAIETTELPAGIYFLRLITDKNSYTEKMVKIR